MYTSSVLFFNYRWIIIISFLWNRQVKNSLDNWFLYIENYSIKFISQFMIFLSYNASLRSSR